MPLTKNEYLDRLRKSVNDLPEYDEEFQIAVKNAVKYWEDNYQENPSYGKAGQYVIVHAKNFYSNNEWTNIGVIVFDENGKKVFDRMGPFGRAIGRGDLKVFQTQFLPDYAKRFETLDDVKQSLGSTGHAMSNVQITEPLFIRLHEQCFEQLYQRCVLLIGI